jgi:glyoxylase-like metal-dependent hydrolase (beta-lactamase superfamily II)
MTNCFVVHPEESGPCWIVDAGYSPQQLINYIDEHQFEPQAVLLTHAHVDHIGGLHDVRDRWPEIPILIHPAERDFLTDPMLNLSVVLIEKLIAPESTGPLEHGDVVDMAGHSWSIRHTPGHSPGGITLYNADAGVAIVGDTLFNAGIGRTDFPTSNPALLFKSIREQLLTLPDKTRVLPGHGFETTIGQERSSNPFLISDATY